MATEFIGIEIGGTKLQMVRGTAQGTVTARQRAHVDKSSGAQGIRSQIEQLLPTLFTPNVAAIGVGFGGPVNHLNGRIACSHQIPGWSDFSFSSWLQSISPRPCQVVVENDANTAALAEATLGAGAGKNPVFYVTLGSGVGGGLVVNQSIYHGAIPGEAEIGHIRLNMEGTIVEHCCSGWAVDKKIRTAIRHSPQSFLAQRVATQSAEGGEARHLSDALKASDPIAETIVQETASQLAFALSHVTHLCHPEAIVLGGGLSLVGEPLRKAVAEALPRWLMEAFLPGPSVHLAQLGEDMVPQGALLLAARLHAAPAPK